MESVVTECAALTAPRLRPGQGRLPKTVLIVLTACIGCGPTTDRLRIRGEVRLDGQPVEVGSISFKAADPELVLAAGAMIREGAFDVPRDKGLPPGVYLISISSPDRDGPKVPYSAGPGRPTIMMTRDRIPASYNLESEHTIELAAGEKNFFEFDIQTSE
ncbi:MAG: hypothetical protein AAF085_13925 [Planctomycetota bacterium]